jgi:hypothetical protein
MSQVRTQERLLTRVDVELIWMGSGGWVAYDTSLPENDARRVLAYLECKDHHVDVTWVREPRTEERFDTLREALEAVRGV